MFILTTMLGNLNIRVNKLSDEFKELISNKWIRLGLFINIIYLIISTCLTLTILRDFNDFSIYYNVGGQFLRDITELYNPNHYRWTFRYFPLFGLLFVPFYLLGFELGFIIAQIINLFLSVLTSLYIYKILLILNQENSEQHGGSIFFYLFLFLVSMPQFYNYFLGQINLYVTILILISLFIFLKYETLLSEFAASFILGASTILKPFTLLIIPFLLILQVNLKEKKILFKLKRSFIRLFGVTLPIWLNFILFLAIPTLWEDFLSVNLIGGNPVVLNHSFSLTKLIINGLYVLGIDFNQLLIILPIFFIFMVLAFIVYVFRRTSRLDLFYGYILGILIMLLVYFDSWDHHLLCLTPLLLISLFILPKDNRIKKYFIASSFLFFCFLDLAFVGLWFVLEKIFPFNFIPTVFLLIDFLVFCLIIIQGDHLS